MSTKQKIDIINMIKNNVNMSAELKESFMRQISQMDTDEFKIFLKSVKEAGYNEYLQEKISKLQEVEKINHNDFLQTYATLSRKITAHEAKKQEIKDKTKANDILNKIQSL